MNPGKRSARGAGPGAELAATVTQPEAPSTLPGGSKGQQASCGWAVAAGGDLGAAGVDYAAGGALRPRGWWAE